VIEPDRDRFLDAARRLAAKDHNGLADPEDTGSGCLREAELARSMREAAGVVKSTDWP
jgi:hypothetical protein